MSILTFKVMSAALIFLIAMIAALLPMHIKHSHEGSRHLTDSVTNGIFLGAAIFHMLPEAQTGFDSLGLNHYPYAILLFIAGFIMLQIVKYFTFYFRQNTDNSKLNGSIILTILSIHSIIEGATLGINTSIASTLVILIAIMAHKSCDSFALATTLKRYHILPQHNTSVILLYALMTPFGIALASFVISLFSNGTSILVEATLNALAAGTFLYIGALDALSQQFKIKSMKQNAMDFFSLLFGIGLMGLLAIWI
jgi:zinc transporter 1/2/3